MNEMRESRVNVDGKIVSVEWYFINNDTIQCYDALQDYSFITHYKSLIVD